VRLQLSNRTKLMIRHPSGRPIRRGHATKLSIARPPREEYLTPGLNVKELPDQIGFLHHFPSDDDWDDEEDLPDEA
jgi:hypothetical protein